jgi:hypothetical protein
VAGGFLTTTAAVLSGVLALGVAGGVAAGNRPGW